MNRAFIFKLFFFLILSCFMCSCIAVGLSLENKDEDVYDVYEAVPVPNIDTVPPASVDFGFNFLYNEEDIQYKSLIPRLKYLFQIHGYIKPTVKLNSFSFTNAKGDTIPSVLYYRSGKREVHIIDSLPIVFTDEMIKEQNIITGIRIFAEGSRSELFLWTLYVNYDIEVGDKHYVENIKYTKKLLWDVRPKMR
ncbi:MAG: hypothetical protein IKN37_08085 [Bacteroidales bacterium]|nr:hypothetical protein [Bacteroidales bacterium]MBR6920255.1 hypothetical protein [Bacteroidales bacterium]